MVDKLEEAKNELQHWQSTNSLLLEQYWYCLEINQPLRVADQFINSPYLLMHKIKRMKCQICHFAGQYKFFRTKGMFDEGEQKRCLVFMVCQSCYSSENGKLPIMIEKGSYAAMHDFLRMIKEGISSFQKEQKYAEQVIKKYDIFENRLSNVIWQLIKSVQKKKAKVCNKIFYQITTMRQMFEKKQYSQIQSILIKSQKCQCKQQCCYCDYRDTNQENMKANCQYYQLKKQQNEVITQINLLSSIEGVLNDDKSEGIFNGIIKQVQMVIINHMQVIENSLDQIVQNTSHFSLINPHFIEQLTKDYCSNVSQDSYLLMKQSKARYIQQGVVNHMTFDDFQHFSNQITSISLDYMKDETILKAKLRKLDKLSKIQVGCNQIGSLFVQQTIKSSNKRNALSLKQSESLLEQVSLINIQNKQKPIQESQENYFDIRDYKYLQNLSFNCIIPYRQQFFTKIGQLPKLSQLYINWNYTDFFQKFNQFSHFIQGKSIINSNAPSVSQINPFYEKHAVKNLWIPDCGYLYDKSNQAEIQYYLKMMSSMRNGLQGLMLGQFDGKERIIQQNIYKELNQCRSLKALFLNKIIFSNSQMCTILQNNQNISSLYFNQCEGFQQSIFEQFENLPYLKKLSMIQIRTVTFKKSIASLQTFILERCYGIIDEDVVVVVGEAKLTHLSLYQCRFIENQSIQQIINQQIRNKSQISFINFGYTKITNKTLNLLNSFSQLRCLHLGGTSLNLSLLLQDICHYKLSNLRRLQKLSLKEMIQIENKELNNKVSEYYNDIFGYVLQYFPLLSHLDLSGNKGINQRAFRFGLLNLTYLNVKDTLHSIKEAKRIDHSGKSCPFLKGRLEMSKGQKQIEQKDSSIIIEKEEKQQQGIKIFY